MTKVKEFMFLISAIAVPGSIGAFENGGISATQCAVQVIMAFLICYLLYQQIKD